MTEELRAHLDALTERNLAEGMSREEARFAALRAFGGVAQIAERARDERRSAWGEHVYQDLRYALRQLRRAPGLTAVTALTLALGIGANTAIFTVVNALMLRSLPVHEPGRLVTLGEYGYPYAKFDLLRERTQTLSGIFAVQGAERRVVATDFGTSESEPVAMQDVSGDYFSVLGTSALMGRALVADDDRAGTPRAVVVLSHSYWRQRFAGDATVIGKMISVNDVPVTIVGVMPPGFFGVDVGDAISPPAE